MDTSRPTKRIEEKQIHMKFEIDSISKNWKMYARGRNVYGPFELSGNLEMENRILKSRKTYTNNVPLSSKKNQAPPLPSSPPHSTNNSSVNCSLKIPILEEQNKSENLVGHKIKLKRQRHFVDKMGNRYIAMEYL